MSFIELDTNVPDLHIVEKGEYELEILSVRQEEGDNPRLSVRLEVVGDALAEDIYHTLWLPKGSDTEKQRAKTITRLVEFVKAFGGEVQDGIDLESLTGLRGRALVDIQPANPERGYEARNRIAKVLQTR